MEPSVPTAEDVAGVDTAGQPPTSKPVPVGTDPFEESTNDLNLGDEYDESFRQNPDNPYDVDGVGGVTPEDLVALRSQLNIQLGDSSLPSKQEAAPPFFDVNGDGEITGEDLLDLMGEMNRLPPFVGESEPAESGVDDALDENIIASPSAAPEPIALVDGGATGDVTANAVQADSLVQFDLVVTDSSGTPAATLELGQQFWLDVLVDDLRDDGQGVFSAYADVSFTPGMASVTGPLVFSHEFPNAQSGSTDLQDTIDEIGAFAGLQPLGADPILLASIPFQATAAGTLSFTSDSADLLPFHEVTIYGLNQPIEHDDIDFGSITVDVIG